MTRLVFILTELFIPILIGYGSSTKTATAFFQDRNIVAWNEDYVNSYVFTLPKGNKFSYDISRKNGLKDTITVSYKGTFDFSSDTIFLKFKGKQPNGVAPYLVLEASRHYFIQYFTDGRKRMFLRIQRRRSYDW